MYLRLQIKTGPIEFDKVRKYHIFILFSRRENAREKVKNFRKGQHCLGRFGLLIRLVAGTVSGDLMGDFYLKLLFFSKPHLHHFSKIKSLGHHM
jgi:hypothetical protein